MTALRVLRTTQVTLVRTFKVDEVPTEPVGAVTVTVRRWDGSSVATGPATLPGVTGQRAFVLTGGTTSAGTTYRLDNFLVTWAANVGGADIEIVEEVEVVGGHLFDIGDFRRDYRDFSSVGKYPTADLATRRVRIESEIERITWRAFVPRFAVDRTYGSGTRYLGLRHCEPRTIRAVNVAGTPWTVGQLATITTLPNGMLILPEGGIWPKLATTVEYEHGWDSPPGTVAEAGMLRLSTRLGRPNSGVPVNAQSYTTEAGAIYRLGQGGRDRTGVPDVDSDLSKFTRKRRAVTA